MRLRLVVVYVQPMDAIYSHAQEIGQSAQNPGPKRLRGRPVIPQPVPDEKGKPNQDTISDIRNPFRQKSVRRQPEPPFPTEIFAKFAKLFPHFSSQNS